MAKPKAALEMAFFMGMVIGLSFVIGWLRMKTQSIWPCVLLHAAHNGFLQTVFDPLTAPVGKAPFITTEFGPGLMLTATAVGLVLSLRKDHLGHAPAIFPVGWKLPPPAATPQ